MLNHKLHQSLIRLMSSSASSSAPITLLRFGPTRFAQKAWQDLVTNYHVKIVESDATNRKEFLDELHSGKFADVSYITRTFESVTQTGLFDKELSDELVKYTKVKAVSHNGAGYDQVDAVAFGEKSVQVSNVPSLVDDATADTHVYLLLSAIRNFQLSAVNMLAGKWPAEKCAGTPIGHDPQGKTLGILGMGGIGRAIRDRMKPFGVGEILYHNRHRVPEELEGGAKYVSQDELFAKSDIISISIPLNPHTKHLINKKTISQMKDGVVIINTARGAIVDEVELIPELKSGKVGSFGSDVWENEPNANPELYGLPNVVCLPHMGTLTYETMKSMEEYVVKNVEEWLNTGKVLALVPEQRK
ncbi:DEKNAAC104393, partial [Brettanomyces naardenensis]